MAVYVVNQSEIEMLKSILSSQAITLGLYGNLIVPDGSTLFSTLTELLATGGRAYARKELTNDVVESAVAVADKWTISTDANGKASAVYSNAAQSWVFNAADVADAGSVYGLFGITHVLAFTAGLQPIKVGDVIRQGAVCAEVTKVTVTSGSWYAGTAAGLLSLKRQVGAFVAGATLIDGSKATATSEIKGLTAAPVVGGTGYAVGDRFFIETGTGGVGRVTAVTAGVVTAVELLTGGKDYTVETHATAKVDGAGDNALTVAVATLYTAGPAVAVATIAGDSDKKLVFVDAFTAAQVVDTVGFALSYTPKMTLASA